MLEYELDCMGYFTLHSVESFALLCSTCLQCTHFQKGLYLKLGNMLSRNSLMLVVLLGIVKFFLPKSAARMWYVKDTSDYHCGCISLPKCNKYIMLTTVHLKASHKKMV